MNTNNSTPSGSNSSTATSSPDSLSIYFAGDLWTHKDLIGNALLAEYIEKVSAGRYSCVVPQNLEQATSRAVTIRNQDLGRVLTCDLAIFNFDGTELDSGTVIEFLFAKMLDIPCVVLRSDFRSAGDGDKDGDPWNLMCSSYPRSRRFMFNAMEWYQESCSSGGKIDEMIERLYTRIASALVENLDLVRHETSLHVNQSDEAILALFQWAVRFPGGGFDELFTARALKAIIDAKKAKGLL